MLSYDTRRERDDLIARAAKMAQEIQQIFDDQAHWNRMNPDEPPIDVDQDGLLLMRLLACKMVVESSYGVVSEAEARRLYAGPSTPES
jgi:hypothetical protein